MSRLLLREPSRLYNNVMFALGSSRKLYPTEEDLKEMWHIEVPEDRKEAVKQALWASYSTFDPSKDFDHAKTVRDIRRCFYNIEGGD